MNGAIRKPIAMVVLLAFVSSILLGECIPVFAQEELTENEGKAAEEAEPTVAVYDLDAKGVSANVASALTDRVRIELFETGKYRVLEREKMEIILQEQGFTQTGACTKSECLVEVGRLLGVQMMVGGSVSKVGELYSFSLRLISIETGEIRKTATQDCRCPIETLMTDTAREVVYELTGLRRKEKKGGKAWMWLSLVGGGGAAALLITKPWEKKEEGLPSLPQEESASVSFTIQIP